VGKLSADLIKEYLDVHLPYRTEVLLAHYKMTTRSDGRPRGWVHSRGPASWLKACFEASLIAGRVYLNMLGVSAKRDGTALIAHKCGDPDDVMVSDLGGMAIDLNALADEDRKNFLAFIIMSNKASAHLTVPRDHDLSIVHPTIQRIHHFLKTNLYDVLGRTDLESLSGRHSPLDSFRDP
jgi:hypothetical protein